MMTTINSPNADLKLARLMSEVAQTLDNTQPRLSFYCREAATTVLLRQKNSYLRDTVQREATVLLDTLEQSSLTLQMKAIDQPQDLENARIYALSEMNDVCKDNPEEYVQSLRSSSSLLLSSSSITNTMIHRLKIIKALLNMVEVLGNDNTKDSNSSTNQVRQYSEKLLDDLLSLTSSSSSSSSSSVDDLRSRLTKALGGGSTSSSTTTTTTTDTNTTMDNIFGIAPTAPSLAPSRTTTTILTGGSTVPSFPLPSFSPSSSSASSTFTCDTTGTDTINDTNNLRNQLHQAFHEIAQLREQLTSTIANQVQGKDPSIATQISTLQTQIQAATKNEHEARNDTIKLRQQIETLTAQSQKLAEDNASLQTSNHNLQQIIDASSSLREDLLHVQQELENREKIIASLRSANSGASTTTNGTNGNATRRGTILSTTTTALISPDEESKSSNAASNDSSTGTGTSNATDLSSLARILKGDVNSIRNMKEEELLHIQENLQDIQKAISRRLVEYHEETLDQSLCIICYTNKKNSVLVPCGHLCVCNDCTVMIKQSKPPKCPVCRNVVEDTRVVYI